VARGKIPDMVTISERPVEDEDRAVPGREGDLIIGTDGKSQIATLVERTSRYVVLAGDSLRLNRPARRRPPGPKIENLPDFLRNSGTWDQGKEIADHAKFHPQDWDRRLFLRSAFTRATVKCTGVSIAAGGGLSNASKWIIYFISTTKLTEADRSHQQISGRGWLRLVAHPPLDTKPRRPR